MFANTVSTTPSLAFCNPSNFKTIIIEGNIGSGKSTFLRHLATCSEQAVKQIEVFEEPIEEWRSVNGFNLLQLFVENIDRWCFPFQSYLQLSRLKAHQKTPCNMDTSVKIMERSLYSSHYCFAEYMYQKKYLKSEEYAILSEWFQYLIKNEIKLNIDLIIYLKTDPVVVYKRIINRGRPEEQNLTLDYLKALHVLHEEWLLGLGAKCPIPAPVLTINANEDLGEIKQVYDKYCVDILNGSVFVD